MSTDNKKPSESQAMVARVDGEMKKALAAFEASMTEVQQLYTKGFIDGLTANGKLAGALGDLLRDVGHAVREFGPGIGEEMEAQAAPHGPVFEAVLAVLGEAAELAAETGAGVVSVAGEAGAAGFHAVAGVLQAEAELMNKLAEADLRGALGAVKTLIRSAEDLALDLGGVVLGAAIEVVGELVEGIGEIGWEILEGVAQTLLGAHRAEGATTTQPAGAAEGGDGGGGDAAERSVLPKDLWGDAGAGDTGPGDADDGSASGTSADGGAGGGSAEEDDPEDEEDAPEDEDDTGEEEDDDDGSDDSDSDDADDGDTGAAEDEDEGGGSTATVTPGEAEIIYDGPAEGAPPVPETIHSRPNPLAEDQGEITPEQIAAILQEIHDSLVLKTGNERGRPGEAEVTAFAAWADQFLFDLVSRPRDDDGAGGGTPEGEPVSQMDELIHKLFPEVEGVLSWIGTPPPGLIGGGPLGGADDPIYPGAGGLILV